MHPTSPGIASQMWVIDQWQCAAHMSVIKSLLSATSMTKGWVTLPQLKLSVTIVTKDWDVVSQLLHLTGISLVIHIFPVNIGDPHVSQNCKLCINFVTEVWVILHNYLSVIEVTEGVRHCTRFVSTVADNDWPCSGVMGCVIQLISALQPLHKILTGQCKNLIRK